jgi:hypothetical protein
MPPPLDLLSWEFWVEALGFWAKDSENLYRLSLIVGGVIGIRLLYIRTRAADRQARTAEQGHITDRFTKAVEQLGSDKLSVRLGAIYALERISRDSRRDHWTIMETLTAYVREHAPWPSRQANPFVQLQVGSGDESDDESTAAEVPRLAPDIQAVLTVLGRREERARKQDRAAGLPLNLAATDLRRAYLGKAHLEGASLWSTQLERARLVFAHLEGANLAGANLKRADLAGAHLEGADLEGADLAGARFDRADLKGATGLTQEQVDRARGDENTTLPADLTRPAHWSKAASDKPDNSR